MSSLNRRALHYVFKIGNRRSNYNFFINILGMKVLRHEEFEEGCKASCNGPYDGRWSKTMIGYGDEDNHFVFELTYNYGIRHYTTGDDFKGVVIHSKEVTDTFHRVNYVQKQIDDGTLETMSSDRYVFTIKNTEKKGDPVAKVSLASSNLEETVSFWNGILKMTKLEQDDTHVVFSYGQDQCLVEFVLTKNGKDVDHAEAFGRIAFSCPRQQLPEIQTQAKVSGGKVLKPLVALDTPGKATVEVVILADPDEHEICFVGDEAFRELSKVDSAADELLKKAMDADKSDEWLSKHSKNC